MVFSRKSVDCPLQEGNESLPQVKEFMYLGVLFTSGGTTEQATGQRTGAGGAVLYSLYRTVALDVLVCTGLSLFLPSPMVMKDGSWPKESRDRGHVAEMGFLKRVAGVSLRDKMRSSVICELGVQPLLLCTASLLVASLGRCSRYVQVGWAPGADPSPGGEIYLCTGLVTLQDHPVRVGCGQGKGHLDPPAETAASATRPQIRGWWWMEVYKIQKHVFGGLSDLWPPTSNYFILSKC